MATGMESLKETVAAMLKDSLKEALDPITKQMVENGNILRSLKEQSETHAKKFDTVFNKIDSMQVDLRKNEKETSSCFAGGDQAGRSSMIWKIDPGVTTCGWLTYQQALRETIRVGTSKRCCLSGSQRSRDPTAPLEIDRAHRIYSNNTSRPRTMIFKLLRYTDRQAILAGARKARPALSDGTQLLFFADYSPGTTQERQGYREIRAKLRRKGIDSFLIYPAILRVNYKGTRMSFNSAEEAKDALKSSVLEGMEDE
ncbi:hypothetical protein AAFF_G00028880 [Aldrovandia affinis]|uniref:LINE-1 type transposase domain-containing 1 n=1 Tax=Aldrovandia affinis TaxID=143900 RepID=A0AAD7VY17_9TELE|nr:hypothetical protein AAFF_G00028880 [Aldrovandia affinis]